MDHLISLFFSCVQSRDDHVECHTIPGRKKEDILRGELEEYFIFINSEPEPVINMCEVTDREMVVLMRMIKSKHSQEISRVMWKIGLFGDLWLELRLGDKRFHVIFEKIGDGEFHTYVKLFGPRCPVPMVEHCSYCRITFDGTEERSNVCSRCRLDRYCDRNCQAMDWTSGHGYYCQDL